LEYDSNIIQQKGAQAILLMT